MISIVLFLFALLAAGGVFVLQASSRANQLHRLDVLVGIRPEASVRDPAIIRRYLPNAVTRNLRVLGFDPTFGVMAGVVMSFAFVILLVAVFASAVTALAVAIVVMGFSAMTVNILATRRTNELGSLLPGFFDRVRQLLVVGNSLPTAFARAIQSAQPRLVEFFEPTIRRTGNGAGISESIRQSAEDIDLYEMHLFATAVSTNMRFGGSLTHTLNNLIAYLRKRSSIDRELRANTAQVRFSAWLLALLPLLVASLIVGQNRDYARWFVADPLGRWLLGYCIVSQVLGVLVMRMILKTEL